MTEISITDDAFRGDLMAAVRQIQQLAWEKQQEVGIGSLFDQEMMQYWFESLGLDTLASRFDRYTEGSLDSFDGMLEHLASVKHCLRDNVHDDITDVRLAVNDWQGAAAEGFERYLGEVETATENQLALTDELIHVISAHKALVEATRADAGRIAVQTSAALEAVEDSGGLGLGGTLIVIGVVVATVAAVAATGGTGGLVIGGIFAGGALQAAGTVISANESSAVTGGNPQEIVESMYDALRKLDAAIDEETRVLKAGLTQLADAVSRDYRDALRPRLIQKSPDGPTPSIGGTYTLDDFRLPPGITHG